MDYSYIPYCNIISSQPPTPTPQKINVQTMFDHTVKKVMQFFISTSYSLKYNKYNINDIKTIECHLCTYVHGRRGVISGLQLKITIYHEIMH